MKSRAGEWWLMALVACGGAAAAPPANEPEVVLIPGKMPASDHPVRPSEPEKQPPQCQAMAPIGALRRAFKECRHLVGPKAFATPADAPPAWRACVDRSLGKSLDVVLEELEKAEPAPCTLQIRVRPGSCPADQNCL
jgi:hypothetical protein